MTDQTITRISSKRIQIESLSQPEYKTMFRAIVFNTYRDGYEEVLDIFEGDLKWVTIRACIAAADHLEVSVDDMGLELEGAQ